MATPLIKDLFAKCFIHLFNISIQIAANSIFYSSFKLVVGGEWSHQHSAIGRPSGAIGQGASNPGGPCSGHNKSFLNLELKQTVSIF